MSKILKGVAFGATGLATMGWYPAGSALAAEAASALQIDEITVTARRREESLQDVPIAISAFGGAELTQRGVDSVANMNAMAPNLSVGGGGATGESQANFRVRGMPGVSVYIDGIDQPSTDGLFTMSVVEVDRIEVLRGPQGTLFGNASLGGAVQYITREPGDVFGARIQGTMGSYTRRDFQAAVDMPLTDTFKAKLTVASLTRDGFMNSTVIERSYGDVNDELYRADFVWTPIDALKIRYNIEQSDTNRAGPARSVADIGPARVITANGATINTNEMVQGYANAFGIQYNNLNNVSGFPGGRLGEHETRINWKTDGLVVDSLRHALDVTFDFNEDFRIRSLTGYKELTRSVQTDYDGEYQVYLSERDFRTRRYDFSQELQLLGTIGESVDWVLGAFYSESYVRNRTITWALPEFTCDLWSAANRAGRGVTAADSTRCRTNRAAALNVSPTASDAVFNAANRFGVTNRTYAGRVADNSDSMTITRPESQALFGDLTWRLTDKMTVAAGLRYSEDESPGSVSVAGDALLSRGTLFPDNNIPNFYGFREDLLPQATNPTKYDAITKRLSLQYQWTPDVMTYIGYSDGYAPGGASNPPSSVLTVNAQGVATAGYLRDVYNLGLSDVPGAALRDEQTVDSFEVGLRADWFGGAVRTNLTAFYTDWQNIPVSRYVATTWWDLDNNLFAESQIDGNNDGRPDVFFFPSLVTVAVTKAEAKGLEFEATWLATEALRINLNVGYLDTAYTELGDGGLGIVPAVTLGTRFAGAPEVTANIAASYQFNLGDATLTPRIDYTYTDDFTLETLAVNQTLQESYALLNARISYDPGTNWDISLQGTNLTDEYYFNSGFYTTSQQIAFNTLGRPREWALSLNYRFE